MFMNVSVSSMNVFVYVCGYMCKCVCQCALGPQEGTRCHLLSVFTLFLGAESLAEFRALFSLLFLLHCKSLILPSLSVPSMLALQGVVGPHLTFSWMLGI